MMTSVKNRVFMGCKRYVVCTPTLEPSHANFLALPLAGLWFVMIVPKRLGDGGVTAVVG